MKVFHIVCHIFFFNVVFRYESGSVDSIIKKYPQEVRDLYAVSRILGSGACGVVRLVFEKSSGKPLAMKIMQKKRFNLQSCNSWESSRLQREANVLRALSNVSFYLTHVIFLKHNKKKKGKNLL